jgi:hypothetical protein
LLGKAAMVLSFDVAADAIDEHDDWHTHEHLPERLSIPGFLRGTRWVAQQGRPRYFVMYEVEELATLASAPYLERLNNPTPWTTKMMTHYRGMTRGFCAVTDSLGVGVGQAGLLIRFKPAQEREAEFHRWLVEEELARLPSTPGLASAHVLKAALTPPTTSEQRLRGSDAGIDWVLLVTGYGVGSVTDLFQTRLCEERFARRGASGYAGGVYRIEYSLTNVELPACHPSSTN